MKNFKEINNTKYHIERVFSETQTIEDIINRKLMSENNNEDLLTYLAPSIYNNIGGSIGI